MKIFTINFTENTMNLADLNSFTGLDHSPNRLIESQAQLELEEDSRLDGADLDADEAEP